MSVKESQLSVDRVKELLTYDPETGIFTWLVNGKRAGCKMWQGHASVGIDGKNFYAHRLAWLFVHGEWPADMIDHINGKRDDNRIENIRSVNRSVNMQNQRHASKNNKVGLLGVSIDKNPKRRKHYVAHIQVPGARQKTIGHFHSAEEAHQAYLQCKRLIHSGCTI